MTLPQILAHIEAKKPVLIVDFPSNESFIQVVNTLLQKGIAVYNREYLLSASPVLRIGTALIFTHCVGILPGRIDPNYEAYPRTKYTPQTTIHTKANLCKL